MNKDVQAGDVLLFHGRGFVSWAIRKFDGTEVNHAAIALGNGKLGEAAGRGLQVSDLDAAVNNNDFCLAKRLERDTLEEVVAAANDYLAKKRPYAYQQIVLLAILATTRKIPLPPIGKRLVRSALDHAAAALNAFVDQDGNRSMICSEFVYRCFEEVGMGDPRPYHIGILLGDLAFGGAGDSLVDWAMKRPDAAYPEVVPVPVSFGLASKDPATSDQTAEHQLAPLIAAYAEETGLADRDLPTSAGPVAFEAGQTEGDVRDEELLGSLASFGVALGRASPSSAESFGLGEVIGGAAAKGAIEGIRRISVEPNFVTPGDLLRSPDLVEVRRLASG